MTRIKQVKEIPVSDLIIAPGQVRVRDMRKEIDELVDSIGKHGLLEPIVVCPATKTGKYEILSGQRRYLAHQKLKKQKILAAVLDRQVDESTARVLSLTENLIRRDLSSRDVIDACTALYKRYGSVRAVMDETALPYSKVRQYIMYDRLVPELRRLVDKGEVELATALRAQDAASLSHRCDVVAGVKLAREMALMTAAQQKKLLKERQRSPSLSVEKAIRAARTEDKIVQILVTVPAEVHRALRAFAANSGKTQDDAAAELLTQALAAWTREEKTGS